MSEPQTVGLFCDYHARELDRICPDIHIVVPQELNLNQGDECNTPFCRNSIMFIAWLKSGWKTISEVF